MDRAMTYDNSALQLSRQARAEALHTAWSFQSEQNYRGIVSLFESVPFQELLSEPAMGFLYARALWRLGRGEEGLKLLKCLAPECEARGNDRLFRDRLNLEAALLLERGEIEEAESLWLETLGAAEVAGDEWILACVYTNLGVVHDIRCEWQQAIVQFQRSMASFQRLGDHRGLASGHHNIAMTHRQLGNLSDAEDHFERAAYLLRRYGSEDDVARCETERALLMNCIGNCQLGEVLGQRALRRFERLRDKRNEGEALRALGIITQNTRGYLRALGYLRRALRSARCTKNVLLEAEVLEELAVAQLKKGRPRMAHPLAEAADRLYVKFSAIRSKRMTERLSRLGAF